MSVVSKRWLPTVTSPWACPFRHGQDPVCLAATTCDGEFGFVTSSRCDPEAHDTCPLYLSKVLHGLRPLPSRDHDELQTK